MGVLEVVIGAAICAVAAWFWITAADIEDEGDVGIGPTAFPRGLAALLGAAALVLVGRAAVRMASGRSDPPSITERPLYVLAGIALVAVFPAVMTRLGYYPAMGLLIPALLWVAGYRKPLGIVLYTAGFLAFTKVVFGLILKVPLP
ncbi:MAG: tripartite tricarboxylate transporter TctB family protein [Pseudomonadota bacterium]|nr:tripartite tricarboxylate transporter TctB family protein [Pseudomonadota bacterium]